MSLDCEAYSGFLVYAPGPPSSQWHHSHAPLRQSTHVCPGAPLDMVVGGRGEEEVRNTLARNRGLFHPTNSKVR